jgi:hypothetical protein
MSRGDQHPFTPEPKVPEPWPERLTTPWEWDPSGGPGIGLDPPTHEIIAEADLKRVKAWKRKQRRKWRERGFSIGFGEYKG